MRAVEQAQPDVDERLVTNRSERAEPSQAHAPEKEQGSRRKELVVIGGQKQCRSGQVLDSGELEGATRCFEWLHATRVAVPLLLSSGEATLRSVIPSAGFLLHAPIGSTSTGQRRGNEQRCSEVLSTG